MEAMTFGRSQEPDASEVQNIAAVLLRWEANRNMSALSVRALRVAAN